MKVSVIIPAWGRTPYLKEAMDALAAQTFRDLEIIRCEPPANAPDAGAARNEGLAQATGEWIMFLDADDLPHADWVEKAIAAGERTGADVVAFRADKVDAANGSRSPLPNLGKLARFADGKAHRLDELGDGRFTTLGTAPWNKAVRAEVIRKHNIRFQSIKRSNDVAFTVELLAKAETFCALDESLLDYRVNHATSLQSGNLKTPLLFLKALAEARRRLEGRYCTAYWAYWRETVAYNLRSWLLLLFRRGL
ncbi:MAG: glycosyltransferase family 2 protein [Kiritimatiellia bacterium]